MLHHIKNIEKRGYTLLPNVFDKSACEYAKKISKKYINELSIDYDSHNSKSSLANKKSERVLNNLQNKDYFYFTFLSNKKICDIISHFLKQGSFENSEPFHLINSQVRSLNPFAKKQQLHLDSNLPGKGGYPSYACNSYAR